MTIKNGTWAEKTCHSHFWLVEKTHSHKNGKSWQCDRRKAEI
jgi:hypothetical protein